MRDKRDRTRRGCSRSLQVAPANYLIVCEGKQTEPNYFDGLKRKINEKYGKKVDVVIPSIDVKGTGLNTVSLVEYTKKVVNQANKMYGQVWVVFDKDDYNDEQFNHAINSSDYNIAWSNPNFELWLLSHFKKVTRFITKEQVLAELKKEFANNGLGTYKKNEKDIFEKGTRDNRLDVAIKNCKQMEQMTKDNKKYSDKNPTTMVYKIVEDLKEYL